MRNPYSAPASAAGMGADGLRTIGDAFVKHAGFLSSRSYVGKVYATPGYIALCGAKDLSAQAEAAVFGLIGMLLYILFRGKPVAMDLDGLPLELAEQLELDRVKPLVVTVLPKTEGFAITARAMTGIRLTGAFGRYSIANGALGRRRLKADLVELGYAVG